MATRVPTSAKEPSPANRKPRPQAKGLTGEARECRVRAIQDTIAAIGRVSANGLSQVSEMRQVATELKVPYLVVSMAVDSNISPADRFCSDADVTEYVNWQHGGVR